MPAPSSAGSHSTHPSIHLSGRSSSIRLIETEGEIIGLQKLEHSEALEHLAGLKERHAEAFSKAADDLTSRGYQPTSIVTVYRTVRLERLISQGLMPSLVLPAGTSASTEEGEVVFWSWDDGDDATWEGQIYVERYSDGAWATYEGQIDISIPDYFTIWADRTGRSPRQQEASSNSDAAMQGFVNAALRSDQRSRPMVAPYGGGGFDVRPAAINQDFKNFLICAVGFCYICAEGCLFAGPFWPECFAICCTVAIVFCAWYHLL